MGCGASEEKSLKRRLEKTHPTESPETYLLKFPEGPQRRFAKEGAWLLSIGHTSEADREAVLGAVSIDGLLLQYADKTLKADRELVLAAVSQNGWALAHALCSPEYAGRRGSLQAFCSDREVVLTAVSKNGGALKHASKSLQEDPDVVLAALSNNGCALQYTSLNADFDFVLTAMAKDRDALKYASRRIKALVSSPAVSKDDRSFQLATAYIEKGYSVQDAKKSAKILLADQQMALSMKYILGQSCCPDEIIKESPSVFTWLVKHGEGLSGYKGNYFCTDDEETCVWTPSLISPPDMRENMDGLRNHCREQHHYLFLSAQYLLELDIDANVPRHQDIDKKWFKVFSVKGAGGKKDASFSSWSFVVISHRWQQQGIPDPDKQQLRALQKYLREHPEVLWVWFDFWCLPQGLDKSPEEQAVFDTTIVKMNWLYLAVPVVILYDLQYAGRFWTCFESFLAMHSVTPDGFTTNFDRSTIIALGAAKYAEDEHRSMWQRTWGDQTWDTAKLILANDDIDVTNKSDKTTQIERMDAFMREDILGRAEDCANACE